MTGHVRKLSWANRPSGDRPRHLLKVVKGELEHYYTFNPGREHSYRPSTKSKVENTSLWQCWERQQVKLMEVLVCLRMY